MQRSFKTKRGQFVIDIDLNDLTLNLTLFLLTNFPLLLILKIVIAMTTIIIISILTMIIVIHKMTRLI